jgi:hypothetical protein
MSKTKKQFFIGSSRKYVLLAEALKELFKEHETIEAVTWSDFFDEDGGMDFTYNNLMKAVEKFEFAVFFLTKDWKLEKSDEPSYASTPNIWFEAGMFMSKYGKENVLMIEEKSDERNNTIQLITDLKGLQPEIITLEESINSLLLPTGSIPNWVNLEAAKRKSILTSLDKVKKKIVKNIFDDNERIFDRITSIGNRKQCYKHGERIIQNATNHLYSIVSYENEYDNDYPNGLFPYIENRLEELKTDSSFTPSKSKKMFKRWMNLANDKIAEQAKHILETHSEYIEIRDTFCNFIEVLISEQEVLLVLPKPENNEAVIGKGVLIKSNEIAREFRHWFNTLIPEPNSFKIDTVDKLNFYRETQWVLENKRMEGDHYRCNACFGLIASMPEDFQKVFKENGLLK